MISKVTIGLLITLIWSTASFAKTYECKAVDKISMLGISPRATVTISADKDEAECKFSVNGAKVGSPPQDIIFGAFNRLVLEGGLLTGPYDPNAIAALLLAAGPDDSIDVLASALSDVQEQLGGCLSDFRAREPGSSAEVFVNDFSLANGTGGCAVLGIGGFEIDQISFRFDENDAIPILLIFTQRGSVTNFLALPKR